MTLHATLSLVAALVAAQACARFDYDPLEPPDGLCEHDCGLTTSADASVAPPMCPSGTADGDPQNGCEADLTSGAYWSDCGPSCAPPSAQVSCDSGVRRIASCAPGFGDCDGHSESGCEASLTTLAHCSGCNQTCSLPNAEASCESGGCRPSRCEPGFGDCDGAPANG